MALIPDKKTMVQSVGTIVNADVAVVDHLLGTPIYNLTETIQYDMATVEGVAPSYNSFSETAKVVSKDGKDVVTLKPTQYNNAISKSEIDAKAVQFGQNEYGDGMIDPITQSALTGLGKLHLNRMVGMKATVYEALTTHKIVGGYIGANGVEDIVFAVPAANKEVFDGSTKKYWSDTLATPLTDMVRAYDLMKVKPSVVLMNQTTYSNFIRNAQVLTADNSSTGKKKNYTINENVSAGAFYFMAGQVNFEGLIIDVYVEKQQRKLANGSYTPFMPNGYVVYTSPMAGELHFGGIPVAETGGIRIIAAEFDVGEVIETNPPQHNLIYRSAPLPVLKNGEAFYSAKVEA